MSFLTDHTYNLINLIFKGTGKYRTGPLVVLHRLDINQLSSISYPTRYVKTDNLSDDEFEPNNDDELSNDQYYSSDMDSGT